jgi:hypothetical protein
MSSETIFEYKTVKLENKYYDAAENIQALLSSMSKSGWRLKSIVDSLGVQIFIFEKVNPQQLDYLAKLKDYLLSE